jgi:hypothetical protein
MKSQGTSECDITCFAAQGTCRLFLIDQPTFGMESLGVCSREVEGGAEVEREKETYRDEFSTSEVLRRPYPFRSQTPTEFMPKA